MTTLAEQIAANVLEAQKLSRKYFVLELNFSDHSIQEIEANVDAIDYTLRGGKSEENIRLLTRVWGSYLGEALRRSCDGEWVALQEGESERLAIRTPHGDAFPLEQVHRRLTEGASANMYQYLLSMKKTLSGQA